MEISFYLYLLWNHQTLKLMYVLNFSEDPQTIAEFLRKKAFRMLGLDGK